MLTAFLFLLPPLLLAAFFVGLLAGRRATIKNIHHVLLVHAQSYDHGSEAHIALTELASYVGYDWRIFVAKATKSDDIVQRLLSAAGRAEAHAMDLKRTAQAIAFVHAQRDRVIAARAQRAA